MFFVAVAGVLGLGHYFWRKINLQPWLEDVEDPLSTENQEPKGFTVAPGKPAHTPGAINNSVQKGNA